MIENRQICGRFFVEIVYFFLSDCWFLKKMILPEIHELVF